MYGFDVSHHDKKIDYKDFCERFDFVLIRATHGTQKDDLYMTHYNQTLSLKQGFYAYTYASKPETAKAECRAFCAAVKPCKAELGYWLDVEDKRQKNLKDKEAITNLVNAWLDEAAKQGVEVGLYSNRKWLTKYLIPEKLHTTKLWLAEWTDDINQLVKVREEYKPDIIQFMNASKLNNKDKVDKDIIF